MTDYKSMYEPHTSRNEDLKIDEQEPATQLNDISDTWRRMVCCDKRRIDSTTLFA